MCVVGAQNMAANPGLRFAWPYVKPIAVVFCYKLVAWWCVCMGAQRVSGYCSVTHLASRERTKIQMHRLQLGRRYVLSKSGIEVNRHPVQRALLASAAVAVCICFRSCAQRYAVDLCRACLHVQKGSWEDISGDTFIRALLGAPTQDATYMVVRATATRWM